jgi:hypothetical protein
MYTYEIMSVIANINSLVGVVPPSQSKKTQQLIAYEPMTLRWLGFKPERARARYNEEEVLNINDQKQYWTTRGAQMGLIIKKTRICQTLYIDGLAERLDAPPSYDESCLPPRDKKSEMIEEK